MTTGEYDEKENFGGYSQLNMSYRKNGLELGAYAFGAKQYQPNNQDLQQKTYLEKTWDQKSVNRQVTMVEAMNFRLDASYQLDANNSIGANFGLLRNPKQTCEANMATEIWQDDELTENSDSRITESMASSFLAYSRDFGNVSMEAGLRYEYIDFNYYEYGKYVPGQSKSYGNWFPSISLSMSVGKVQMQLSYATDIDRPSYHYLRSGIQYDNRYTYETGNPFLVSEISKNLNYELAYKWLTFDMTYSHTSHTMMSNVETYKDNPAIGLLKPVNGKAYNHVEASVNLRPSFGIWYPSFTASVDKQWFDMETHDGKSLNKPMASFRFDNTLNTKLGMFTLMMSYITKGHEKNLYLYKPMFCMNVSAYKAFLKDRLSFQLFIYDLFGTNDSHMIAHFGKIKEMVYDGLSTSKVSLTVRYKFNTTRSKYKGTGAGESQKNRM